MPNQAYGFNMSPKPKNESMQSGLLATNSKKHMTMSDSSSYADYMIGRDFHTTMKNKFGN